MSIKSDCSGDVMRFLKATGAKFESICDRLVMLIPIKNWGYAPVEGNEDMMQPHQDWVLVIEETGDTWIWDSWILEG